MADIELTLLGPPQILYKGKSVDLKRRKAVALLAYLAVTQQTHSRPHLAALLWPEYQESSANAYLRQTLWTIRKAIPGKWLSVERERVVIKPSGGVWLDLDRFRELLAESRTHSHPGVPVCPACISLLRNAVELHQDDFMAGFTLRDTPEFDRWQYFQLEKLRRDLANSLERLVYYLTEDGALNEALVYTQRWLSVDPLHEIAHQTMMYLLASTGQRTAALQHYLSCEQTLADELGIEPLQDTSQLYAAIRDNLPLPNPFSNQTITTASLASELVTRRFDQDQPSPQAGVQRPRAADRTTFDTLGIIEATPFIGREAELAQVTQILADPKCRLLTLIGPGGVGKTRLAQEVVRRVVDGFPDRGFFVPLAQVSSPEFIVSTISRGMNLSYYSGGDPRDLLLNFLREKKTLLILDNYEHLAQDVDLISEILKSAPGVKLLVTSRERLKLTQEWVYEVKGLKYPLSDLPFTADQFSAVELFLQTAQRSTLHFSLTDKDRKHIVRICQMLDGLPLGIELAAGWLRALKCEEIADEIEKNLDFLTASVRDLPARHQSLRAVFDHSWSLLDEDERRGFRRLSVFRGQFRRDAAETIADTSLQTLLSLLDKSMLQRTAAGHFEIHNLLRQFAEERLDEDPEENATVQDRHCGYYADFIAAYTGPLSGGGQKEAVDEIETEIENIRQGWYWALKHWKSAELDKYLDGLFVFYELRGWFQEGERTFGLSREIMPDRMAIPRGVAPEDQRIIGKQIARQGAFTISLGDYEKAGNLLDESLILFRRLEDEGEIAFSLYHLGDMARMMGEYDEAKRLLEESILVCNRTGERRKLARALNNMGIVTASQGDYSNASQLFQASIDRLKEIGDLWGIAKALNNLGIVTYYYEQFAEANRLYQESLEINQEIGDRHGVAISLNNLGLIAHESGDFQEAVRLHQESLDIFTDIGYTLGAGICLNDLGRVALAMGDNQTAEGFFHTALETAVNLQAVPLTLSVLNSIAALKMDIGDKAGALTLLAWVASHPACDQETKTNAELLIDELKTDLQQELIDQAWEKAAALDTQAIRDEILGRQV